MTSSNSPSLRTIRTRRVFLSAFPWIEPREPASLGADPEPPVRIHIQTAHERA